MKNKKSIFNKSPRIFISDSFISSVLFLLALLGSVFSPQIFEATFSIPFQDIPKDINVLVVMYWISVLIFLKLAHVRQTLKSEVFDARLKSLSTLPPKDITLLISTSIRKASDEVQRAVKLLESYGSVEKKQQAEIIQVAEKTVRTVLDNIIDIAQLWDDPLKIRTGIVYRANVMIVIGIDDDVAIKHFVLAKDFSVLKTYDGAKKELTGLIVLENNLLTTTTKSESPDPDTNIKPIAFPFTDLDEIRDDIIKRQQNLLGAPYAVVNNKPCFITDTSDIVSHLSKEVGFDDVTKKKITEYYTNHKEAHSICSIPLNDISSDTVIGVINIYRNQVGMLQEGERMEDYSNLITPFIIELSRLLPKLFEVKQ